MSIFMVFLCKYPLLCIVLTEFMSALILFFGRSSFCFGLVEPSIENPPGMLFDLDDRINLDYLPFLKAMAVAEDNADRKYLAAKEEINAGALGLQVGNIGRRSTRRAAKVGREHYFHGVVSRQGLRYEEARICAKQISDKLSKEMLQY